MTEKEYAAAATEIVKRIVDCIADGEYAAIAPYAEIDPSWGDPGQTQPEVYESFGEWLDEQLAMWEEDEEKGFVVDHFDESCIDEEISFEGNRALVSYSPTNDGEKLDLWFEIDFRIADDGKLKAKFNVNV